jgi:hypothetical protein
VGPNCARVEHAQKLGWEHNATMWFQQDSTSHTAQMNMEKSKMFLHCLMSQFHDLKWQPRFPDFSASDYILWGYLKSCIFEMLTTALDELKASIREVIHDALKCMMDDFTEHLQCITAQREYLLHSVFKK